MIEMGAIKDGTSNLNAIMEGMIEMGAIKDGNIQLMENCIKY